MKKILKRSSFILVFVTLFLLASCDKNSHIHTFSNEWSYDSESHYHVATCGDTTEVSNSAAHTFSNGKCSICGYKNAYTVSFDLDGGESEETIEEMIVRDHSKIENVSNPIKEGYTFAGWYYNNKLFNLDSDVVTSDMTLIAKWKKNLTINFNANGGKFSDGSLLYSYDILEGDYLTEDIIVGKEGYIFDNWYKDKELTEVFSAKEVITSNITLYAGWKYKETSYTIYLNYDDKVIEQETKNGRVSYIPEREGYIFNGYYVMNGSEKSYKWETSNNVTISNLVLSCEWIKTDEYVTILTSPNVKNKDSVFYWDSVNLASSYDIKVYENSSNNVLFETNITTTSWQFPTGYEPGSYKIRIRSVGDGINSVNSTYKTIVYEHYVLAKITNINLDNSTSILTWDKVLYANEYELYINNEYVTKTSYPYYDMTSYDAGEYDIKIKPLNSSYLSYESSYSVTKLRLKTPEVKIYIDNDKTYYLVWDSIINANSYVIEYNDNRDVIKECQYSIALDSSMWVNDTIELNIYAFDSNTNYIKSLKNDTLTLTKVYELGLSNNIDEYIPTLNGNKFDKTSKVAQSFSVTFDYNYDGARKITKTITSETELTYPAIPTRSGYLFTGWYKDDNYYDFSSKIESSFTLKANWHYVGSHYTMDPTIKNTSSNYYSISNSSSGNKFVYFTVLTTGICSFYYKKGSSNSMSFQLYNVSRSLTLYNNDVYNTSSYYSFNFNASKGDVFELRIDYASSYTTTNLLCYITGANIPSSTGNVDYKQLISESNSSTRLQTNYVKSNNEVTVVADEKNGYKFLGWYDGDTLLSTDLSYTFMMPNKDVNYVAKYEKE